VADPNKQDLEHLRHSIRLSEKARLHGNQPFGAVLVTADGEVLAAAENAMISERDLTAHAEMNALRIASKRARTADIACATMYASGEPCPMCSGAMLQYGLRRIVFGIRWQENCRYHLPPGVIRAGVSCRDVLRLAPWEVEIIGPLLEEEARAPFEVYAAHGIK
jgi:tRNA(adenine34) deaminase